MDEDNKLVINDNAAVHFANIINNRGSLKEFENKLDEYIGKEIYELSKEREENE